ncbi:MAG: hypothetical protein HY234_08375 [Acidobacteria bacterium]|nr:hypothetical protein [Acidobacteriota bacterium]MBI3663046.1 hypothetical protein [Acidobacteriota bacterium]
MRARNTILTLLGLVVAAGLFLSRRAAEPPATPGTENATPRPAPTAPESAATQPAPQATTEATEPVPPYLSATDAAGKLPRALPAADFKAYPVVAHAYRIAERIPAVLAQQPCYCHCDKFGHGSLLDCFASDHGAG